MLEKGKTYSWEEFLKYSKIDETYKVEIEGEPNEDIPILKENETYIYVEYGHYFDEPRFFAASNFLPAFMKLLGNKSGDYLGNKETWYDIANYYECGNVDGYNITFNFVGDILEDLLESYGVTDHEDFANNFLKKLPNVTETYASSYDIDVTVDLEECDYLAEGTYNLTVKKKKGDWKIQVNDGFIGSDDDDFWGILDEVQVTIVDIL